jgi:hypothetical protein
VHAGLYRVPYIIGVFFELCGGIAYAANENVNKYNHPLRLCHMKIQIDPLPASGVWIQVLVEYRCRESGSCSVKWWKRIGE